MAISAHRGVNDLMGYEPVLDGVEALEDVLGRAGHRKLGVVAKYTVFLHPETVAQTNGEALFRIARTRDSARRGCTIERPDGSKVMVDDNTSPTLAFKWAAQQGRGPDIQFNHIYKGTNDPDLYTALWNICVTPAFLAKLTDVKRHGDVVAALKRRSFDLYDHKPKGEPEPEPPEGYDSSKWHDPPPPVPDLEAVLRARLNRAPSSRPAKSCREIGWYFSRWEPEYSDGRRGLAGTVQRRPERYSDGLFPLRDHDSISTR